METSKIVLALSYLSMMRASDENCIEYLTAESGWFSAPDDDGNGIYNTKEDCWWIIEASRDQVIKIEFIELDIVCVDFVRIFDGLQKIGTYCNTPELPLELSRTRVMRVQFKSGFEMHRGGFNATYELIADPECGYRAWQIAGSFGTLDTSVNINDDLQFNCEWEILHSDTRPVIQVYVGVFTSAAKDWKSGMDNTDDAFVKVIAGTEQTYFYSNLLDDQRRVVSAYKEDVQVYLSVEDNVNISLLVHFTTTDGVSGHGGILTHSDDIISFVNEDLNCVWLFVAPEGHVVEYELDIIKRGVYMDFCQHDFIETFDGYFLDDDAKIQSLSEVTHVTDISSIPHKTKTNVLILHVVSASTGCGFQLTYLHVNASADATQCQIQLNDDSGWFGYSNDGDIEAYGTLDCWWRIEVFTDKVISIVFHEIEVGVSSSGCGNLEVYGSNMYPRTINCRTMSLPISIEFYDRTALVTLLKLKTNVTENTEFNASYSLTDDPDCGYKIRSKAGGFGSSDADLNRYYTSGIFCEWIIVFDRYQALWTIYIAKLDFARQNVSCERNGVALWDHSYKYTSWCVPGGSYSTFASFLFYVFLIAESDVEFQAFHVETDLEGACGGILTNSSGVITSVDQDQNGFYDNYLNCVWIIIAEDGYVVDFEFLHVDLEKDDKCRYDYIEMFNGTFHETASVLRICGHWEFPKEIWVRTNTPKVRSGVLYIQFFTDSHFVGEGFNMTFNQVNAYAEPCGGYLSGESGWLVAPDDNDDGFYNLNADCLWTIELHGDKVVKITFQDMNVECFDDFIMIYDGYSPKGPYCGTELPKEIIAEARRLHIMFVSDSVENVGRFHLNYEILDDTLCGYLTSNIAGRFGSINTDINRYRHSRVSCKWTIQVSDAYSRVQVYITKLKFSEQSSGCERNALQIFNDTVVIGSYCEQIPTTVITSASTFLYVLLKSDNNVTFDALYSTTGICGRSDRNSLNCGDDTEECGGILIQSPGVIRSMDQNQEQISGSLNCVWLIVAPEGSVIKLEVFGYVDIRSDNDCSHDLIQLYQNTFREDSRVISLCESRNFSKENVSAVNTTKVETSVLFVQLLTDEYTGQRQFNMTYEWEVISNKAAMVITATLNRQYILPNFVLISCFLYEFTALDE